MWGIEDNGGVGRGKKRGDGGVQVLSGWSVATDEDLGMGCRGAVVLAGDSILSRWIWERRRDQVVMELYQ